MQKSNFLLKTYYKSRRTKTEQKKKHSKSQKQKKKTATILRNNFEFM